MRSMLYFLYCVVFSQNSMRRRVIVFPLKPSRHASTNGRGLAVTRCGRPCQSCSVSSLSRNGLVRRLIFMTIQGAAYGCGKGFIDTFVISSTGLVGSYCSCLIGRQKFPILFQQKLFHDHASHPVGHWPRPLSLVSPDTLLKTFDVS